MSVLRSRTLAVNYSYYSYLLGLLKCTDETISTSDTSIAPWPATSPVSRYTNGRIHIMSLLVSSSCGADIVAPVYFETELNALATRCDSVWRHWVARRKYGHVAMGHDVRKVIPRKPPGQRVAGSIPASDNGIF